jgi:hypothetical protein
MDVQRVTVHVRNPDQDRKGDYGQVDYAYYTVWLDRTALTLTTEAGVPIRNTTGKVYTQELGPEDNPQGAACELWRRMRRELHGEGDFNRPLVYRPASGIV